MGDHKACGTRFGHSLQRERRAERRGLVSYQPETAGRKADTEMATSTASLPGKAPARAGEAVIATDIPARLDRLRWGRFHTLVVPAAGIKWIPDGPQLALAGSIAPSLKGR